MSDKIWCWSDAEINKMDAMASTSMTSQLWNTLLMPEEKTCLVRKNGNMKYFIYTIFILYLYIFWKKHLQMRSCHHLQKCTYHILKNVCQFYTYIYIFYILHSACQCWSPKMASQVLLFLKLRSKLIPSREWSASEKILGLVWWKLSSQRLKQLDSTLWWH